MQRMPVAVCRSAIGLLVALAAAAAAPAAESGAASPSETAYVLNGWRDEIERAAKLLEAGAHAKARKASLNLLDDMTRRLGEGEGAAAFLARAIALRALAESGLGNVDTAFWYWDVARAVDPGVEGLDLTRFGAAGARFTGDERPPDEDAVPPVADPEGVVVQPRIRHRVQPEFTYGARVLESEGVLVVALVIGTEGGISRPTVVKSLPAPALTYAALEALRKWRFEPATVGGQPVSVYYTLTVNYKLRK